MQLQPAQLREPLDQPPPFRRHLLRGGDGGQLDREPALARCGGLGGVCFSRIGAPAAGAGDRVVITIGPADAAAVLAGADVYVQPSIAAGFGAGMLDAMSLGIPVLAADLPALQETAAEGAHFVADGDDLGDAIRSLLDDDAARERLVVAGRDRAKAFTWRDAAEKVWQLHADL